MDAESGRKYGKEYEFIHTSEYDQWHPLLYIVNDAKKWEIATRFKRNLLPPVIV